MEVERLDRVRSDTQAHVLRASGRAWAATRVQLAPPVLVADAARIAAESPDGLVAGPDGPGWSAEFRVPERLAHEARAWGVEVSRPAAPEPVEALTARIAALETLARARSAGDDRLTRAEAARREAERLLGIAATERDEAAVASGRTRERLEALDEAVRARTGERDGHAAERDRALLELDAVRGQRDDVRRQEAELRAELARVESRWQAAAVEVRELRAKLRVSSVDRAHLVELLEAATTERDVLRGRLEARQATAQGRGDGSGGPPTGSGWLAFRSRPKRP